MVDLEACVGAVVLVIRTAATLQLIYTLLRKRRARDSLQLCLLLFGRQELLLLFFEKERAMVEALHEVRLAELFPLGDFVSLV